jgi:hypothetical protein
MVRRALRPSAGYGCRTLVFLILQVLCFGIARDAVAFIKPGAKINQLATLGAEGAPALFRDPDHRTAACRAADCLCFAVAGGHYRSVANCSARLDDTAGQFEFHILICLLGAFFIGGKLQKAGREPMASATQFCEIG